MKLYIRSARTGEGQSYANILKDKRFDSDQMEQIRLGLESGVDISLYADPKFNCNQSRP